MIRHLIEFGNWKSFLAYSESLRYLLRPVLDVEYPARALVQLSGHDHGEHDT